MKKFNLILTVAALSFVAVFSSCRKEQLAETPASATTDVLATDRSNTVVDIAVGNPNFSILVAAVVKTNLAGVLSASGLNGTVFAPTNAAFQQLPAPFNSEAGINGISDAQTIKTLREIVRYHVVKGARTAANLPNGGYQTLKNGGSPEGSNLYVTRTDSGFVYINGVSRVVAADVQASNGVIHVVDKVLLPPTKDIAQIAVGNPNFTALVAAVQKTGLTNVLMSKNLGATVFAPTDAAFAQLPAPLNNAANIRAITDPNTINTLRNVLRYHLIGARVFSTDLRDGIVAPTLLSGSSVTISLQNGATVKGSGNATASNIIGTDILALNGVIHVIDQVLLP